MRKKNTKITEAFVYYEQDGKNFLVTVDNKKISGPKRWCKNCQKWTEVRTDGVTCSECSNLLD